MRRLTDTDGLTEFQRDILRTVRDFVDAEVLPVASELDHADVYPDGIVTRLKELGVFGLTIDEQYGGLGESANADEYTPYAEYCTGSAATPGSACATIGSGGGWFGIGGTSLSSPLWAAVTADRDSYQGRRTGNRARSAAAGRDQQRPVPDHTRLRRGDRHRLAEVRRDHHRLTC